MPPAASVIAAARAAVEADPYSVSLRLHLSTLLLDAGEATGALPHVEWVLATEPENVEALLQATRACEAVGDGGRAERYLQLATKLSTGTGEAAITGPSASPDGTRSGRLTFTDVGGLDHVKHRLQVSVLSPMRDARTGEPFGRSRRGGILLFGPPGCGKTLIGQALAGELSAHFIRVGVAEMATAEAGSNREVEAIFDVARQNSPAVVFLDALEAVGPVDAGGTAGRLVAEMDRADNDGVLVLASSAQPWNIDAAMLAAGRFDHQVLVLPPDRAARVAILRKSLGGRGARGLNLEVVAEKLDGYSATDLADLCRVATEVAGGEGQSQPITREDLEAARGRVRRSTPQWFTMARNFEVFASTTGMYDDLMVYMRSRRMV